MQYTGWIKTELERKLIMSSIVVYFSAEAGTTKRVAENLARPMSADIYEIKPENPYTQADLKWTNPLARCNREKIGKKDIPVEGMVPDWEKYDTVYLGFPIWYYGAPNVIKSFCRGYDWSGKNVYIFATSGGSGIGKTAERLEPFIKGGKIIDAKRVSSAEELSPWMNF